MSLVVMSVKTETAAELRAAVQEALPTTGFLSVFRSRKSRSMMAIGLLLLPGVVIAGRGWNAASLALNAP